MLAILTCAGILALMGPAASFALAALVKGQWQAAAVLAVFAALLGFVLVEQVQSVESEYQRTIAAIEKGN